MAFSFVARAETIVEKVSGHQYTLHSYAAKCFTATSPAAACCSCSVTAAGLSANLLRSPATPIEQKYSL